MSIRTNRPHAYTLLELMIVLAIIAILSGIQVGNYFYARQKTDEAVRLANKRTGETNAAMGITE
jgi:prepilin-type N-terminal cleavage/methylation domain-containing protein